ncbi:MAG: transcriptional regulator NrdR [Nanoarchaeota archaeon]|nr:transcriptional regulator NrdR [Nanoarchaeota archaeon]MBU0962529.1 transcriptional regulator NrdR [Nanoarchaeota archaeon]
MRCPYCLFSETKVIDKRQTEDLSSNRRRRECLNCKKRFTTYEKIEMLELFVIKKDGSRQPYNRDKIKIGILKACEKRPISIEIIENLINNIESEILKQESIEISSKFIGSLIMKGLKKIDKVAYIRFASVYLSFDDPIDFSKELKILKVIR